MNNILKKERHKQVPAVYAIITRGNKILLLKRANSGYEDGNYSFIAGHVEQDETFTDALLREAKEEAGIILDPEKLKVVHVMHRRSSNYDVIDVYFSVKEWQGEIINNEPNKCDEISWFDIDNLPENTIEHVKTAVSNFKNKIFYSEFGWDKKIPPKQN